MSQSFITKIADKIEEATVLEIVTIVGEVDLSKTETTEMSGKAMRSRIDLVGGDIATQLDPAFVTGDYQALREFHTQREKEGNAIVQRNIETLKALIKFVRDDLSKLTEGGPEA